MVHYADTVLGETVDLLKDRGMYNDTLIIFLSGESADLEWPPWGGQWPREASEWSGLHGAANDPGCERERLERPPSKTTSTLVLSCPVLPRIPPIV